MRDFCFVVDIWEGQAVDLPALRSSGVAGVVVRLNDMNGGHHMDAMFPENWQAAEGMIRWPYFVYNPWVDGRANYDWLSAHMPPEARAVSVDVEVKYSGYPPAKYAAELQSFLSLASRRWKIIIYTAEWFLPSLSKWPASFPYWWAQYPAEFYQPQTTTWDALRDAVSLRAGPDNVEAVPGPLVLWQFTGDRIHLPGSAAPLDVSVFLGSASALSDFIGSEGAPAPDPVNPSGLYQFSASNYFARGGGPLVLRAFFDTKKTDAIRRLYWPSLKAFLRSINPTNPSATDLISAPDWGPSKGLDGEYIRWISLLYPGRNVVRVERVQDGLGVINGITPRSQNPFDNPEVIHQVYDYNRSSGWGPRARPVYVPILGGPLYVDMAALVSVDAQLPKTVTVTAFPWLNVRAGVSALAAVVSRKLYGTQVIVREVRLGGSGIWGRVDEGWVALRYNDKNMTSWAI